LSNKKKTIKIGTRGSALALQQANWVKERISYFAPDLDIQLIKIKTKGDKILDVPLAKIGGKGLFVKEIEEALLRGDIDLAVHSMKDLPIDLPAGLIIGAVPQREEPRDALITSSVPSFCALPPKARLGTSSLRRGAQLLHYRSDLNIIPLRGNLDTRIKKLKTEELDGIVVAAAGLYRMGWKQKVVELINTEICLPAVGQGALAIEIKEDSCERLFFLPFLNDPDTFYAVTAERAFLRRLGGGCQVPIAALAEIRDQSLQLTGMVSSPDGKIFRRKTIRGKKDKGEKLGITLAERLLDKEIAEILEKLSSSLNGLRGGRGISGSFKEDFYQGRGFGS
jgi:hydroxymethylbilane synthase